MIIHYKELLRRREIDFPVLQYVIVIGVPTNEICDVKPSAWLTTYYLRGESKIRYNSHTLSESSILFIYPSQVHADILGPKWHLKYKRSDHPTNYTFWIHDYDKEKV